jgi:hypothetical protein
LDAGEGAIVIRASVEGMRVWEEKDYIWAGTVAGRAGCDVDMRVGPNLSSGAAGAWTIGCEDAKDDAKDLRQGGELYFACQSGRREEAGHQWFTHARESGQGTAAGR